MAIKDRRRLDDYYSRKARQEGYPARSVYKLEELDAKHRLFKNGQRVLDLGCAPGGWTLYAAQAVGPQGLVLGLDRTPPDNRAFPRQVRLLTADLLEAQPEQLLPEAGLSLEIRFDVVLSDLAPKTMGRREVDQARSLELARMAWSWAETFLASGGDFLLKIFQSPEADEFLKTIGLRFSRLIRLKPKATRNQSMEIFALARGFAKAIQT